MATEHKDPVLIFEAEEVLTILRKHSNMDDHDILAWVREYCRGRHDGIDTDTLRFHESGLVICDLKPTKKGK
jgi:serine/threonine protein kinase